jgi:ParB-like chromosome segregation protein Spo0J
MATHCHIDEIKVGPRFRKRLGNIEAFARSIEQVGLLHPIVIDQHFNLVAGQRRLEALRLLIASGSEGFKQVPIRQLNLDDLMAAEHDENVQRLDFAPSEAVAIAEAMEARLSEQAKARQLSGLRGQEGPVPPNRRDGEPGEVRDRLAACVGMGRTKLGQARAVVEAARRDPARYGDLVERMDETRLVDPAYKELKKRAEQVVGQRQQTALTYAQPGPDDPYPDLEHRHDRDIRVCSPEELLASLDHRVDAIVTEAPPTLYGRLAELAKTALKPTGCLAVVTRNVDLSALMVAVTPHLPYLTTIPILTVYGARGPFAWRPVVVFGEWWKGNRPEVIRQEPDVRGEARDDSRGLADLIGALTRPLDMVADPFMCDSKAIVQIGRTLFHPVAEACLHLNRSFVGADQDGIFQGGVGVIDFDRLREMVRELKDAEPGRKHPIRDDYGKVEAVLRQPSTYPKWMGTHDSERTRARADRIIRLVEKFLDRGGTVTKGPSPFGEAVISREDSALLSRVLELASSPLDEAELSELLNADDEAPSGSGGDAATGVDPADTDIE